MSRLYVGQIPKRPLRITVVGATPGDYDTITVVMLDPQGDPCDLTGSVTTALDQTVSMTWPTDTPFETPGDYTVRVLLDDETSHDITSTATIEVYSMEARG